MKINFEGVAEFLTLGFTLNGKTMIKNFNIPTLPMPSFDISPNQSTIDDVYQALTDSVRRSIRPNMALALSGGLDSRIIAGLIAECDKSIPAYTTGYSNMEKKIAKKICSVLKLRHYTINCPTRLNEKSIEHVKEIVKKSGGVLPVNDIHNKIVIWNFLRELNIKSILTAAMFDEITGGVFAYKITSMEDFCKLTIQSATHPILSQKYRKITFKNLTKSCKGIEFRKLYALVHVKNLRRDFKIKEWPETYQPIIDSRVLSTINSLPYKQQVSKHIQKKILRKYFPELYLIPYAKSMLPPFFPYIIHRKIRKPINVIHKYTHLEKPVPLLTFDVTYYIRNSIPLLRNILLKHPPPLLETLDIKKLIDNINTSNAILLSRLSTYALLKE